MRDDVEQLRSQHPGWAVNAVWTTVDSGPDYRKLLAWRGRVMVAAATAAELSIKIEEEERGETGKGRTRAGR